MRRKFTFVVLSSFFFLLLGSMIITSCTKEGPAGPPGADGEDGANAAETCTACHDFSENLLAKVDQYDHSVHASGANINRNYENCSQCHTSQGFRTFLEDGSMSNVAEPTAINCRTCHPIHETYTMADYSVRTSDPVALLLNDAEYDYENSNLCVNCHQARPVNPYPAVGGGDITITNARWGPHYSTQSNMFAGMGKGAIELPGSETYRNSTHANAIDDGCITCHMSTPYGYKAGGHQMNVKYGEDSYNLSACSDCHSDMTSTTANLTDHRTEIQGLLEDLKTLIEDQGLMNPNGMFTTPITLTATQAGAVLNYKLVYYDRSYGAHNYPYTKALLVNSIEALNPGV